MTLEKSIEIISNNNLSLEETKKYLTDNGFTEYPLNQFTHEGVCACFQKCKRDANHNKVWFIDADIWDWTWVDKSKRQADYTIAYSGQYYQKGTHDAMNIEFIGWELEQVEAFINELFEKQIVEAYEND